MEFLRQHYNGCGSKSVLSTGHLSLGADLFVGVQEEGVAGNGNEEDIDGLGRNHGRFANRYACENETVQIIIHLDDLE